jgi:hypothetical protein
VETCYGVRVHASTMVDGRKVPVSMYYVGRGKDGQMQNDHKAVQRRADDGSVRGTSRYHIKSQRPPCGSLRTPRR